MIDRGPGATFWAVETIAIAVGVATGFVGLTLKIADGTHAPVDTALSVLGGFLFLAAGVVALTLRPANRTGVLMVLVGTAGAAGRMPFPSMCGCGIPLAREQEEP